MEADLVNAFVEKQRDTINEFVAKNVMLEARLVVVEKKLQQAADLSDKIADGELQLKLMRTQNESMSVIIDKQKLFIDSTNLRIFKLTFRNIYKFLRIN